MSTERELANAWQRVAELEQRIEDIESQPAEGLIARLEQERDEWIGCHARLHRSAGDLLALIHRDGGHYIRQHGIDKAFADAEQRIYDERGAMDAVAAERDDLAAKLRAIEGQEQVDYLVCLANPQRELRTRDKAIAEGLVELFGGTIFPRYAAPVAPQLLDRIAPSAQVEVTDEVAHAVNREFLYGQRGETNCGRAVIAAVQQVLGPQLGLVTREEMAREVEAAFREGWGFGELATDDGSDFGWECSNARRRLGGGE